MQLVTLLLRWFHVIPAIAMVGGLIYMRFVLPKSLATGNDEQFTAMRSRWAKIVMGSTLLLLLTGITNMVLATSLNDYGESKSLYSMLAGMKFLLALPVFFLAARLGGKSSGAAAMRQKSDMWLNVTLAVALVVIMIGGFLRNLPRQPKTEENSAQAVVPAASEQMGTS